MVAVCGDNSLEKRSSYNVIYDVFPLNLGLNVMKRKDTTKLSLPILISSWCALCEHFPWNCIIWEPAANSAINTNPYYNIQSHMRRILDYRQLIFVFIYHTFKRTSYITIFFIDKVQQLYTYFMALKYFHVRKIFFWMAQSPQTFILLSNR